MRRKAVIYIRQIRRMARAGERPPPSERPHCRAECQNAIRPCPFVTCRHHLYLNVTPRGSLQIPRADREPDELAETCSLDVAEQGEHSLEIIGHLLGLTRERVRQIEAKALKKFRKALEQPNLQTG